jgi:hypothetical protein
VWASRILKWRLYKLVMAEQVLAALDALQLPDDSSVAAPLSFALHSAGDLGNVDITGTEGGGATDPTVSGSPTHHSQRVAGGDGAFRV